MAFASSEPHETRQTITDTKTAVPCLSRIVCFQPQLDSIRTSNTATWISRIRKLATQTLDREETGRDLGVPCSITTYETHLRTNGLRRVQCFYPSQDTRGTRDQSHTRSTKNPAALVVPDYTHGGGVLFFIVCENGSLWVYFNHLLLIRDILSHTINYFLDHRRL